eukprot:m.905378 g.905378  ORF g.905378 m.905378 type:complete len:56 (-) comp23699_c0_seq6:2636-2803(-)
MARITHGTVPSSAGVYIQLFCQVTHQHDPLSGKHPASESFAMPVTTSFNAVIGMY